MQKSKNNPMNFGENINKIDKKGKDETLFGVGCWPLSLFVQSTELVSLEAQIWFEI